MNKCDEVANLHLNQYFFINDQLGSAAEKVETPRSQQETKDNGL